MAPRSSDHDLLITISAKIDFLTEAVKTFPKQLAEKADLSDFVELKTTVTSLQRFRWSMLGGIVAVQALAEFFLHLFK